MSRVRRNLAANFASSLWVPLIALAAMPLYRHFLGAEAVGLIGLFALLQALTAPLDAGLSMTLNRQFAQLQTEGGDSAADMGDLLRTLETIYWLIAAGVGLLIAAGSPLIAWHWVRPEQLTQTSILTSIALMALALAMQFPFALYQGGLMGLEHQVLLAGLNIVLFTVRFGGGALVVWLIRPSVELFFVWQVIAAALHTGVVWAALWRRLPKTGHRPRFRKALLHQVRYFAAGIGGISLLALVLTQMDKIVLTGMLRLEAFGDYTMASMIAMGLARVFSPVFLAVLPRLTALTGQNRWDDVSRLYHTSCQAVSVLTAPVAAVIIFFAGSVLWVWTGDGQLSDRAGPALALLTAGTLLNALMTVPFALQVAWGWTRLQLMANAAMVVVMVPTMILLTRLAGMTGAAAGWAAPFAGSLAVTVPLMHRRLLKGAWGRWALFDALLPTAAAFAVAAAGRLLLPPGLSRWHLLGWLLGTGAAALAASALAAPAVRARAIRLSR